MLQFLLFLIGIGVSLYLWERFPAFKWVLATIIAIPLLSVAGLLVNQHFENKEKERIEADQIKARERKEIEDETKMYEELSDAIKLALSQIDRQENSVPKLPPSYQAEKKNFITFFDPFLQQYIPKQQERKYFLDLVWYESYRAGIEPRLVLALIYESSAFNRMYLLNADGLYGYLAVPSFIIKKSGIDRPESILFDSRINLRTGLTFIRLLLKKHNDNLRFAINEYRGENDETFFKNFTNTWHSYVSLSNYPSTPEQFAPIKEQQQE